MSPGRSRPTPLRKSCRAIPKQEILNNTLTIFEEVYGKIAGPNAFKAFDQVFLLRIIGNRYPAVKIRRKPDCDIQPGQIKILNEIFKNMLANELCETSTGEAVPPNTLLREGLMMLYYVELIK
ncbi:MAG TPA: hypothetical protein VKB19_07635 [Pedobacter sp.]|nr:hypothetical protein [Pedobacter sp.]